MLNFFCYMFFFFLLYLYLRIMSVENKMPSLNQSRPVQTICSLAAVISVIKLSAVMMEQQCNIFKSAYRNQICEEDKLSNF